MAAFGAVQAVGALAMAESGLFFGLVVQARPWCRTNLARGRMRSRRRDGSRESLKPRSRSVGSQAARYLANVRSSVVSAPSCNQPSRAAALTTANTAHRLGSYPPGLWAKVRTRSRPPGLLAFTRLCPWRLADGIEHASPARGFPVTPAPELRVPSAETEDMPFYLRTFCRLLSSWVHRGVFAEFSESAPRTPRSLAPALEQRRVSAFTKPEAGRTTSPNPSSRAPPAGVRGSAVRHRRR
jgi:hypothetical protein